MACSIASGQADGSLIGSVAISTRQPGRTDVNFTDLISLPGRRLQ